METRGCVDRRSVCVNNTASHVGPLQSDSIPPLDVQTVNIQGRGQLSDCFDFHIRQFQLSKHKLGRQSLTPSHLCMHGGLEDSGYVRTHVCRALSQSHLWPIKWRVTQTSALEGVCSLYHIKESMEPNVFMWSESRSYCKPPDLTLVTCHFIDCPACYTLLTVHTWINRYISISGLVIQFYKCLWI